MLINKEQARAILLLRSVGESDTNRLEIAFNLAKGTINRVLKQGEKAHEASENRGGISDVDDAEALNFYRSWVSATMKLEYSLIDTVLKHSHDRWLAAKWLLEKLYPKKYGDMTSSKDEEITDMDIAMANAQTRQALADQAHEIMDNLEQTQYKSDNG